MRRPRVGPPALESLLLTFVTGVRFSAIVVVNFINGPWLTVWAVTARQHETGTRWGALYPHVALSLPQAPAQPTSGP